MLLNFASGDTVGQSTKWFHTYMMVNMGDPVAHIEPNESGLQIDGIDKSLGIQIADSRKSQIHNFFEKDMNKDGLDDILVQYLDGYIELFLNLRGKFRSAGKIFYAPKIRDSKLDIADFQGDGYSDIVSLDDE